MSSKTTRFEKLLEAVPDALVGMDQKGVIRFVNRQTEALFGFDRDQLIGQPIEMLVPESLWQIYTQHRQGYFADPRTRSSGLDVGLSGRQRDGTDFPINVSMSTIDTGDVLLVITAARDVAQRQQAVRNAGLAAAIVEFSDDAIIGVTLKGTITSWNPAAEQMYGYSSRETIGKSLSLLVPVDRAGELTDVLATIRAGQRVKHLETNRVRKDGTMFSVSITLSPIRDAHGVVVGASVIGRDVSEVKRAAQYAWGLIEADPDPLGMISPEGTITDVNEATVKATGVPRDKLIGTDFSQYFTDPDAARKGVQRALAQGSLTDGMLTVRHQDGTLTDFLCNATVYRDINGQVIGLLTAARDMTNQKEAFEAAQRMAAIARYSGDAIIDSTLEGIITSWNPAAEAKFGYASDEIMGRPLELLTPEGRTGEFTSILSRVKVGRLDERHETTCVRKDGTAIRVLLTVVPIRGADGAVAGFCVIVSDLTE